MSLAITGAAPDIQKLYERACAARHHAHSPYSGCRVGAALLLEDGDIYAGCNIENASYGAAICAERAAVCAAVSERGAVQISAVMVVSDASPPWPPCGMCRQVITEFGPDALIHCANLEGELTTVALRELFPSAFTARHLQP